MGDTAVPVSPPALKDERFQLVEFSRRRLRLRLARARLEDEGGYFCQLYADDTHHQIATLTVLGRATGDAGGDVGTLRGTGPGGDMGTLGGTGPGRGRGGGSCPPHPQDDQTRVITALGDTWGHLKTH